MKPPKNPAKPPRHDEWEVLCALLNKGQLLDVYEEGDAITRAALPAGIRPQARPVSRGVVAGLLARGWLAKHKGRRAGCVRVSSYRLSLRGWYALRRTSPNVTGRLKPGDLREASLPTSEITPDHGNVPPDPVGE